MNLDEQLKRWTEDNPIPIRDAALSRTIRASKAAFWQGEEQCRISWWDFVCQQAGYIRKEWWGLQSCLLLLLWLLLRWAESDSYDRRCMGILAPVFIILTLPELWKNDNCRSIEVEGAALFPLRSIVAARMLLFGMVDLALLTFFFTVSTLTLGLSIQELIVDFLLPLLMTCCICVRMLYMGRNAGMIPSLFACLFWLSQWTLVVLREEIYSRLSLPVWMGAAALSLFYLCFCTLRWWQNREQQVQFNV